MAVLTVQDVKTMIRVSKVAALEYGGDGLVVRGGDNDSYRPELARLRRHGFCDIRENHLDEFMVDRSLFLRSNHRTQRNIMASDVQFVSPGRDRARIGGCRHRFAGEWREVCRHCHTPPRRGKNGNIKNIIYLSIYIEKQAKRVDSIRRSMEPSAHNTCISIGYHARTACSLHSRQR